MAELPLKTRLYKELQLAVESGIPIPEFGEKTYVYWKEEELVALKDKYLNPEHVEPPQPDDDGDDFDTIVKAYDEALAIPEEVAESLTPIVTDEKPNVHPALSQEAYRAAQAAAPAGEQQTYTDWVSELLSDPGVQAAMQAQVRQAEALATAPAPAGPGYPEGITGGVAAPSAAEAVYAVPREQWAQVPPRELARLLGVPFSDKVADRAGLTFNTHGPNDILRIDSRGMVWFRDEVPKPAIPKRRMRRKVKTVVGEIEEVQTFRPDGGLDETFEVDGGEQHEIEIKISMPTSQVGIYVDPRMPFKIHQYNGKRAFDLDEVVKFYGGTALVPSTIETIYVDIDLCYTINSVKDTMEREYREEVLGRSLR